MMKNGDIIFITNKTLMGIEQERKEKQEKKNILQVDNLLKTMDSNKKMSSANQLIPVNKTTNKPLWKIIKQNNYTKPKNWHYYPKKTC
jgi:hypothetical protein